MKTFYFKNYKSIHHFFTLIIFIGLLLLTGNEEILTSFPFQLMILIINYFIVKYSLKHTGIDKEVERRLNNIENKKEIK